MDRAQPKKTYLRTINRRSGEPLELLNALSILIGSAYPNVSLDTYNYAAAYEKLVALARASRAAGLITYCSISLHVLEQLWPMNRGQYLPVQLSELVRTWTALSIRHLEKPTSYPRIVALVELLANLKWERPVGQAHCQLLVLGLVEDWSSHVEEFHMSTGVFDAAEIRGAA